MQFRRALSSMAMAAVVTGAIAGCSGSPAAAQGRTVNLIPLSRLPRLWCRSPRRARRFFAGTPSRF